MVHPPKTNMTLKEQRFEDFLYKNGDVPLPVRLEGKQVNVVTSEKAYHNSEFSSLDEAYCSKML